MLGENLTGNPAATEQAVRELEGGARNTGNRSAKRLDVASRTLLHPGNASQRDVAAIRGVCNDISERGCRVICSAPPLVGDIYRVEFERSTLDVAPQFARCLRVRFLQEDAFESGFAFFTPVLLPTQKADEEIADLI